MEKENRKLLSNNFAKLFHSMDWQRKFEFLKQNVTRQKCKKNTKAKFGKVFQALQPTALKNIKTTNVAYKKLG